MQLELEVGSQESGASCVLLLCASFFWPKVRSDGLAPPVVPPAPQGQELV